MTLRPRRKAVGAHIVNSPVDDLVQFPHQAVEQSGTRLNHEDAVLQGNTPLPDMAMNSSQTTLVPDVIADDPAGRLVQTHGCEFVGCWLEFGRGW